MNLIKTAIFLSLFLHSLNLYTSYIIGYIPIFLGSLFFLGWSSFLAFYKKPFPYITPYLFFSALWGSYISIFFVLGPTISSVYYISSMWFPFLIFKKRTPIKKLLFITPYFSSILLLLHAFPEAPTPIYTNFSSNYLLIFSVIHALILAYILYIGPTKKKNTYKTILISYRIISLLATLSFLYILFFFFIKETVLYIPEIITFILFLSSLLLVKLNNIQLGHLLLIISLNSAIYYFAIVLGPETATNRLYFAAILLPIIIFHRSQFLQIAFGIFLSIACYVLSSFFQFTFLLIPRYIIPSPYLEIYSASIISFTFLITLSFALSYLISTDKHEIYLKSLNAQLNQSIQDLQTSNKNLNIAYTALKESQEASKKLAKHAAFASLTRGIAHEIRNPLQMLQGRATLVLETLGDKEKVKKFAEVMIRNTTRLASLLKTMLEYGASAGDDKTSFSINTVLKDIQELSHSKCFQKKLTLTLDLSPNLTIFGNKIFIYQALLNLVVNAIQYTPNKGKIILKTEPCHYLNIHGNTIEGVKVSVIDTGPGIPKDKQKEIFHPYHTTKNLPENTGLGLSIAQKTFIENNGLLDLYTTPGAGTTFMAYLPGKNKHLVI